MARFARFMWALRVAVLGWRCRHRWVVHEQFNLVVNRDALPHGTQYVLRCTRCGWLRNRKFR